MIPHWFATSFGLFGTVLQVLLPDPPQPSDVHRVYKVPAAALESAQKCLDEDWKVRCTANPTFYGLRDSTGISGVELQLPFVEYVIRGNQLSAYVGSPSYDPRPFASLTKYVYPIVMGDVFAGGLVVLANQTEDGSLIDSTWAPTAYVCTSFYPKVEQRGKLEEYRERFPVVDGYTVEFVRIMPGTTAVMVTDRLGEVFVLDGETLVPLSEAGSALKTIASTADELRLRGMQRRSEE